MRQFFLAFLLLAGVPMVLWADWHPVVYNYTPQMYGAGTQNWQLAQSEKTGWVYAANNYGLLEFDGVRWRLFGANNGASLRSVTIGAGDRIYVGGGDEFGVFVLGEYDERVYYSFVDCVPSSYRPFGEVWAIHESPEGHIYFQTRRYVFETDTTGTLLHTVHPGMVIYKSVLRGDNLYMATDLGLYLYSGGRMHRLGEWPAGTIISTMEFCDDLLLIGTDFGGVYCYSDDGLCPFPTDVDAFLKKNQLYSMAVDGCNIALGTVLHGLVIIDKNGHFIRSISRERALQNNTVLSMLYDRDHNLWVGEDLGLDHVSLLWPTEFLGMHEPCGVGYATFDHGDYQYLGTNQGLYCMHNGEDPHMVASTAGQVWRLCAWDDMLFCCHNRGLWQVHEDTAELLPLPEGVWNVWPIDERWAWACTYNGLYLLERSRGDVQVIRRLIGYGETLYCTALDRWGRLWTNSSRGVVCLTPDSARTQLKVSVMVECDDRNRLSVVRVDDDVLVTSNEQILLVQADGSLRPSAEWETRLGGCQKYTQVLRTDSGYVAVSPGVVQIGNRVIFDKEGFFIGGFDNASLSSDGQYVLVGGTDGFYRIRLQLALMNLPNHPWKEHAIRIIVPWYETWWAKTLLWIMLLLIIGSLAQLIRYLIRVRDERLARDKEAEIHRQQMRILQLENDKAKYELEEKNRKLSTALLGRVNRNEIIAWVQQDLRRVADSLQQGDIDKAKQLLRQTEGKLSAGSRRQEKDWQNFEESFDSLNPEFVLKLRERHPDLSEQEVKLCVYILQGLQTKEIGPLVHLSTRGVEMMRYRMRTKMNLPLGIGLKRYILDLAQ